MKNLFWQLWADEEGIVISTELVFVVSILGIGMIVGLSAARDGVTSELADISAAVSSYNQGYQIDSITGHGASLSGSFFRDQFDFCNLLPVANTDNACITRTLFVGDETTAPPIPTGI